jgi:hypothetical protein
LSRPTSTLTLNPIFPLHLKYSIPLTPTHYPAPPLPLPLLFTAHPCHSFSSSFSPSSFHSPSPPLFLPLTLPLYPSLSQPIPATHGGSRGLGCAEKLKKPKMDLALNVRTYSLSTRKPRLQYIDSNFCCKCCPPYTANKFYLIRYKSFYKRYSLF